MFMGGAEIKWDGSQVVARISKHHVSMREFVDDKQTVSGRGAAEGGEAGREARQ
jgi:hypothetical protein